jgi:hypothetical protein
LLKTTTVPFLALCFAGFLAIETAAATTTDIAEPFSAVFADGEPMRVAQAAPTKVAPAATAPAAPVPAAPVAQAPTASKPAAPVAQAAPVVPTPTAAPAPVDSAKPNAPVAVVDSAKNLIGISDSARAADSAKAAQAAAGAATTTTAIAVDSASDADSAQAKSKGKKRKRVVRETTVNTIDDLKGRYRSPKRALFMSMIVPGLGQAYVGQHWSNYARGAFYFLTDVALAYGWHYYVVERQDAQIAKYKNFADKNWSQYKYEDSTSKHFDPTTKDALHPHRQTYCESVQEKGTPTGNGLFQACRDANSVDYPGFKAVHDDRGLDVDTIAARRAAFPNTHAFYEMIGKEPEFITGWMDAKGILIKDSSFYATDEFGNALKDAAGRFVLATTPDQQEYIGMRAKANDYARMQAYFLGGMVVNHIVSAIDAALAAHYHNKSLYQTETNWYDRIRLDSHLAWSGYAPAPTVTASFTF